MIIKLIWLHRRRLTTVTSTIATISDHEQIRSCMFSITRLLANNKSNCSKHDFIQTAPNSGNKLSGNKKLINRNLNVGNYII